MTVKIEDIAKKLNISKSTVSRSLSGSPRISEKTKKLVIETAKSLNYRPNLLAQSLRVKKTRTIGLIISDITNPFYPEIVKGVEEANDENEFNIILCNTDYKISKEINYLNLLYGKMVDGILLTPTENIIKSINTLESLNVPYVLIDIKPSSDMAVNCVFTDIESGSYQATKYLISKGHEKIAIVNGSTIYSACNQFARGFIKAMTEAELNIDSEYMKECNLKTEGGIKATEELILNSAVMPSAIIYISDKTAEGGYETLKSRGLKIPYDISIIGFDDIPEAKYFSPPLTTIKQPKFELGFESMKLLLSNLYEKNNRKYNQIKLLPDFVVRESVTIPKNLLL